MSRTPTLHPGHPLRLGLHSRGEHRRVVPDFHARRLLAIGERLHAGGDVVPEAVRADQAIVVDVGCRIVERIERSLGVATAAGPTRAAGEASLGWDPNINDIGHGIRVLDYDILDPPVVPHPTQLSSDIPCGRMVTGGIVLYDRARPCTILANQRDLRKARTQYCCQLVSIR